MKRHYWLVTGINWNKDHYDYFTLSLETSSKAVTKKALEDCAESMSKQTNGTKFLITAVSYLGHMTEKEFINEPN